MTGPERQALLLLARAAIVDRLLGGGALEAARRSVAATPALEERRGVFVTLKVPEGSGGLRLRGCIGSIVGEEPIRDGVVAAARAAAFSDPRFPPLTLPELHDVVLSVSALTVPSPAGSADAIVAGEHGVVLEAGSHRAVFLPQVAAEQGWTTPTLLAELARKAGLPPDGWREGRLFTFRSENFGETPDP